MSDHNANQNQDIDIFARLQHGIDAFTPQQKKLCLFTYENYRDAAFMTIEQMSEELDMGSATVMRTIRNLGYDSYKDFISALRNTVINQESTYWRELRQSWEKGEADPSFNRLAEITRQNVLTLENSLSPSLLKSFELATEQLRSAKKLLILGLRSSRAASYYFYFMLHEFIDNVYLADVLDSEDIYSNIVRFDENDVFVAFSLGGPNYAARTHEAVRVAYDRGIPVILIADTPKNPSAQFAKALLSVSSPPSHYSMVPIMNLLDALIANMGTNYNKKRMSELEKINRERHIVL